MAGPAAGDLRLGITFFWGRLISTPVRDWSQNHQLFQPALLLRWAGAGMMMRRRR